MTIYIDSLFLLDFIVDYLLLLLTGKLTGSPLVRWRLLLAAALGGAYTVACVLAPPFLRHPLVKLSSAVALVLISYGHCRRLLRCTLIFLALSAAFGGGLYALSLASGVPPLTLNAPAVLLFSALAYGLLSLAGRKLARHSPAELRRVTIHLGSRSAILTALLDNGNTLTDPMTGQGVPVVEGDSLASLLPPEADYRHPAQCFQALPDPGAFRLLPYRSVGVDRGLLLAVRADAVEVEGKPFPSRLIALSPTPVSDTGTYQALLFEE